MKRYHVKLTIEGLTGSFAEKYSHIVKDAQWLDLLLQQTESMADNTPIDLFGGQDELRRDPMPLFPAFMKLLRRTATKAARRRFFTGVRYEPADGPPSPWSSRIDATQAGQPITVSALGLQATVARAGEAEDLSKADPAELSVDNGRVVLLHTTWETLFRADLTRIIEMLEETMAKDTELIARRLDVE
ncbi:MAG: hypothetical protein AUK47_04265 [Deltaproteobacteria bacterium CG2_30_63_29]|nr:MAG: hypothetical protein AUK47_04265 [Deltaproteobacteria bacterium CG2_30_63_29]PJB38479.1 MAG: hypothetical protein CO108_18740 [Deltaproteobacteria bacterium CG_4_9_14_3_um_filter_63_12]